MQGSGFKAQQGRRLSRTFLTFGLMGFFLFLFGSGTPTLIHMRTKRHIRKKSCTYNKIQYEQLCNNDKGFEWISNIFNHYSKDARTRMNRGLKQIPPKPSSIKMSELRR